MYNINEVIDPKSIIIHNTSLIISRSRLHSTSSPYISSEGKKEGGRKERIVRKKRNGDIHSLQFVHHPRDDVPDRSMKRSNFFFFFPLSLLPLLPSLPIQSSNRRINSSNVSRRFEPRLSTAIIANATAVGRCSASRMVGAVIAKPPAKENGGRMHPPQ